MQSWTVPAAAIVGWLLMPLSPCAPGGAASATTGETPSKDLGSEKVALTVATIRGSGAPLDKIIAAFEKTHPNITVTNKKTRFDNYNKQLLAPNSSPGEALIDSVGNMAKDKLLPPLNPYKALYG